VAYHSETEENHENLRGDSPYSSPDSNLVPPDFKSEALPVYLRCYDDDDDDDDEYYYYYYYYYYL
jgi:hypothetical protein